MANDRVEEVWGLRIRVPAGWTRSAPPKETHDAFQPLLACVAPEAPVAVTVAVRPAGGAPAEHAARAGEGFNVDPAIVAGRVGAVRDGTRVTDAGPVRARLFFFEDAGTLWRIETTAPAPLWPDVETALTAVIASAELRERPAAVRRPVERAISVTEAMLRLLQVAAYA